MFSGSDRSTTRRLHRQTHHVDKLVEGVQRDGIRESRCGRESLAGCARSARQCTKPVGRRSGIAPPSESELNREAKKNAVSLTEQATNWLATISDGYRRSPSYKLALDRYRVQHEWSQRNREHRPGLPQFSVTTHRSRQTLRYALIHLQLTHN